MVFCTCIISQIGYELIKICIYYIAIKAGQKYHFFLSPKRISEQEFETTFRLKMKEDGCSVGTSIGKVFRSISAELFHSYTWSLNICLPPSSEMCNNRDVLGEERILPRTPLAFGGKQSGGGGMLGTFSLFCLRYTS